MKLYEHIKTGKLYELVQDDVFIKDISGLDDEGEPILSWHKHQYVLYKALYDNPDGPYFVRTKEDFYNSFRSVEDAINDAKNKELEDLTLLDTKHSRSKGILEQVDNVNHPAHYEGNIECIDAMEQQFGAEYVQHFCLLNAFKYLWRCNKKHDTPIEDIKKAIWYLNKYLGVYQVK